MRKIIAALLTAFTLLFIVSCESTKTSSTAKPNTGYIQLVGNKAVYNGIIVIEVDNKAAFEIDINSDEDVLLKRAATYAIKPGAHTIYVYHNDEEVLFRKIFVSDQEILTVELP